MNQRQSQHAGPATTQTSSEQGPLPLVKPPARPRQAAPPPQPVPVEHSPLFILQSRQSEVALQVWRAIYKCLLVSTTFFSQEIMVCQPTTWHGVVQDEDRMRSEFPSTSMFAEARTSPGDGNPCVLLVSIALHADLPCHGAIVLSITFEPCLAGNALKWGLQRMDASLDDAEHTPPAAAKLFWDVARGPVGETAAKGMSVAAAATVKAGAAALQVY